MSFRSAISSLGRVIAAALKATARGAVWTTRRVYDAATGVFRIVAEVVSPPVPVAAAQDAAEAYLDAAAQVASATPAVTPEVESLAHSILERNNPLAVAVKAWAAREFYGEKAHPQAVDISTWPENLQTWLHSLGVDDLQRVAHAPILRLEQHLRAQCEPDLMPGLRPVLTIEGARRDTEARREAVIRALADDAGVRKPGARRGGSFKSDVDVLADLAAGEVPMPLTFR